MKIWKSLLAKKLVCPAYRPARADPSRMEVFRAMHEQIRLEYRIKMKSLGWQLLDSGVPIENSLFKGRIDDLFTNGSKVLVVEYVSSLFPRADKLYDTALSTAFLRFENGVDAEGAVFSREEITQVPNFLIDQTWKMVKSLPKLLNLNNEGLLEFANPESGLCSYCDNGQCKRNPENH